MAAKKTPGDKLRDSIVKGLAPGWQLDDRESALLDLAAAQADDLAELEAAIKSDGRTVVGSKGQPRLHPAVTEARQARLALGRLLGELQLPDEDAEPRTAAGKRGQKAAEARWSHRDRLRAVKNG